MLEAGQRSPTVAQDEDGFIKVDRYLRTSIPDVFAAGDCCAYDALSDQPDLTSNPIGDSIDVPSTNNFFQMRLWTQVNAYSKYYCTYYTHCPCLTNNHNGDTIGSADGIAGGPFGAGCGGRIWHRHAVRDVRAPDPLLRLQGT